jgi:pimeloyl-ACP methyl ester carboxylesterase
MASDRAGAVLVPGAVLPGALAYAPLLETLGDVVEPVVKDLELYADDRPPPQFTVELEIEGIARAADAAGFERFHLVGYSGGGAVSLGFAARYPDRLRSLALVEPAWDGNWQLSSEEEALWRRFGELATSDRSSEELMGEFMTLQLRPGVEPPPAPPGPQPPWMATRPAGIKALIAAFREGSIDPDDLRAFGRPVYFALGALSNPDYWERMATRLGRTFDDFTPEVYEGRHHFDPPHRAEPERFGAALRALWARADPSQA